MNWDLFCQARGMCNRIYAAVKPRYYTNCSQNLDDFASANVWWHTPKGHMFSAESDVPPLYSPGGAHISDPAGKAELLSAWFCSKQSRGIVELPQTCHSRQAFCGIAFRACEALVGSFHMYNNLSGCFPMFFSSEVCFCSFPETESTFS